VSAARVLVVEDERIVALDLRMTLGALGHEVAAEASNARDALAAAAAERPDLALLDIRIDGEPDGIEVARRLRDLDVPVIFLSAFADEATVARAREAEPYGFLVKPFHDRELRTAIEVALYRHRSERERRELEARLAISDRLAALGTMTAGIAHELNNPLACALANEGFALECLAEGEAALARGELAIVAEALREAKAAIADAREGDQRVRRIVSQLHVVARQDSGRRAAVALDAAVRAAADLASHELAPRARWVHEPDPGAPRVLGNEGQLVQLALNLLVNAAQAIPPGAPAANTVATRVARAPDGRALLEVRDTGSGIPPDRLARIFDPFFSTRMAPGLGLSVAHGIVTAHGGEIAAESAPGAGTTMRVLLPPA
jgi:signal transduction histidine kinase